MAFLRLLNDGGDPNHLLTGMALQVSSQKRITATTARPSPNGNTLAEPKNASQSKDGNIWGDGATYFRVLGLSFKPSIYQSKWWNIEDWICNWSCWAIFSDFEITSESPDTPKWWLFMDFSSYSLFKQIEETWHFLQPTYVRKFDERRKSLAAKIGHNSPPARCSNKKNTQQHPPFLSCTYRSRVTTGEPTNPIFWGNGDLQEPGWPNAGIYQFPFHPKNLVGGFNQPIWKNMQPSNCIIAPGFGVNMKNVWNHQLVIDFMEQNKHLKHQIPRGFFLKHFGASFTKLD